MEHLQAFHPSVAQWFAETLGEPTPIQQKAWAEIQQGRHTLIAAPTGSGKTLAAFFTVLDQLYRKGLEGQLAPHTQVVYVSPLKALSNDIERNLQVPLQGIREQLKAAGLPDVNLKVGVRTGDTTQSQRAAQVKNPPHILVTTPETLFNLLTSEKGREMLCGTQTLIIDEIHALVQDKRGSHLALTVERLEALTERPLQRIGLSATQKPVEKVAAFLTGGTSLEALAKCAIIDTGHKRQMELKLEVPNSPLTAVMANEVWEELYEKLEQLILQHQTTLIFVNTRRLSERLSHTLGERLGKAAIAAHHGSMSKEHRLEAEQKLKAGELRCIVATASLELGIDIGSVDLVCQIASPKSIAAFLQRVGRSGHSVKGTPKGHLFPLTRDELVECSAILHAVHRGELDTLIIPEKPIDVLAQQIVAEVAAKEWDEDALFEVFSRAYPYRDLTRNEFDEVLTMLSEGFTTRRGRRGAYLHHDVVNKKLRGRKGARLTALVSGGSIPDLFDVDVYLEPSNTFIGTVNEDFAIESLPGDIFKLGNNSWQILRVENGKMRVADAHGQPPSIPFWLGEAPGRSIELSEAVSLLREEISTHLGELTAETLTAGTSATPGEELWKQEALAWVEREVQIDRSAADQLVTYLATAKAALKVMPSQNTLVLERFFDEAGDMHLVIHAPFGSRLNRAWGLSLRKRFCRKFNFELQAAANEDAIVLSLGATHSFQLDEVYHYLKSETVRDVLIQALLDAPMFEVRWRWNASRALAVIRRRAGEKVPAQLQRMAAEDLVSLVFPDQLACLENISGAREVPDHPLIRQTIHDCLTEAMDIDALEALLKRMENDEVVMEARDLREPSALAQEILNARPYAFLDDAPLEERRTRAIANRRWLDPADAADLGQLDGRAIEAVKEEAWPTVASPDELHDALILLGAITATEGERGNLDESGRSWTPLMEELIVQGRATVLVAAHQTRLWVAAERLTQLQHIYTDAVLEPVLDLPEKLVQQEWTREKALLELIRGRVEGLGPAVAKQLADELALELSEVNFTLTALEGDGFVFRGQFTPDTQEEEWCERRLLARIHRYTMERLRREIEPVSAADFMRFLFHWHGLTAEVPPEGPEALQGILSQLEGYEAPAAAWEADILPARMPEYDFNWLDFACLSGRTVWGRFRPRTPQPDQKVGSPIKTTPITLVQRSHLKHWLERKQDLNGHTYQFNAHTQKVWDCLQQQGASFFDSIVVQSGLLPVQVEEAISELVSCGLVTADSFTGLRALLVPAKYKSSSGLRSRKQAAQFTLAQAGRWTLLDESIPALGEDTTMAETLARILLQRYGVVFRKLADREHLALPWRELTRIYRRMEARGEIRGGRFVEGVWGEQFALPEAVTRMRALRRSPSQHQLIAISAADPLNLQGIITPGRKISAFSGNRILYLNGEPVAVLEAGEVQFLREDIATDERWSMQQALVQKRVSPRLRAYLGKGIG